MPPAPLESRLTADKAMKPYWKITLWYLGFGIAWIFLSDRVTEALASGVQFLTILQTIKGWLFVLASGLLIFALTRRAFRLQLAKDEEILSIFKKTVEGSHHILLNYLNQMQLVTMEADRSKDFNREIIKLANSLSDKAADELMKLAEITTITTAHIESVVYSESRNRPHA